MAFISEEEKLQRQQANDSVLGSLAMEGLAIDDMSAEIGRRFIEGEINLEQFSAAMQSHVEALTSSTRPAHRIAS